MLVVRSDIILSTLLTCWWEKQTVITLSASTEKVFTPSLTQNLERTKKKKLFFVSDFRGKAKVHCYKVALHQKF